MHPETLKQYELALTTGRSQDDLAIRVLAGPHHFHVSRALIKVARALAEYEGTASFDRGEEFVFPTSSRLPAESMVLTHEDEGGQTHVSLLIDVGDQIALFVMGLGNLLAVGSWVPGRSGVSLSRKISGSGSVQTIRSIMVQAFIISLMNEPRRVTICPAGGLDWTRQHRRQVKRLTGRAAMAYSLVSWQIGAGVKAKRNPGGNSDLKVALHWCRAHWRRAEAHHPRSEWVKPHLAARAGWHTWVQDCWKGHPDHGIKLQRHEPRMVGEQRQGVVAPMGVPSALKLNAMTAQQRHTLVEAGFAPTAAVQ
ncbi:hypothetical protein [Pararhodobacter sp.]|uniref:hypothetical protein n=1 Tax=Pararhodobacter sp. TaxID=2127056 RepID=UPI002FDDDD1A